MQLTIRPHEVAEVMQRRKFCHGCLHKVQPWMPQLAYWAWCVETGDGRWWFGATPQEAWERFTDHRRAVPYRGPRVPPC